MRYDSGVFYSLRYSVISGNKCRVRPGALSIARSVIPHSANYPSFRSLLPQISFRKLLSAFPQIINTHVTPCQPIKRIVYQWLSLSVLCQIMVLCSYVLINLVLCILLCVKIIVQTCAFIGLLASTFVCWGLFCWAQSTCSSAIGNSNCGRGYTCLVSRVLFHDCSGKVHT